VNPRSSRTFGSAPRSKRRCDPDLRRKASPVEGAEGRVRARRARGQHDRDIIDTVGINADGTFPKTNGEQTRRALAIIRAAIEALGGRLEDIVRTRMFVIGISRWERSAPCGELLRCAPPQPSHPSGAGCRPLLGPLGPAREVGGNGEGFTIVVMTDRSTEQMFPA
jgi:hypothetical protein